MILFGSKVSLKKTHEFSINFDNVTLKPAASVKLLGVVLDRELNMEEQTSRVVQRCYGNLMTIRKLIGTLPRSTLLHVIRALVFPHIGYCLPAWAPPTQLQRHRLDKVINFATRVVTGKRKHDHISDARQSLGWMPFSSMIQLRDSVLMHALLHQAYGPERLKSMISFRADSSERVTRATETGQLQTSRCRLEATKRTVPYRAIKTWNGLAYNIREMRNTFTFKQRVKKALVPDG